MEGEEPEVDEQAAAAVEEIVPGAKGRASARGDGRAFSPEEEDWRGRGAARAEAKAKPSKADTPGTIVRGRQERVEPDCETEKTPEGGPIPRVRYRD